MISQLHTLVLINTRLWNSSSPSSTTSLSRTRKGSHTPYLSKELSISHCLSIRNRLTHCSIQLQRRRTSRHSKTKCHKNNLSLRLKRRSFQTRQWRKSDLNYFKLPPLVMLLINRQLRNPKKQ